MGCRMWRIFALFLTSPSESGIIRSGLQHNTPHQHNAFAASPFTTTSPRNPQYHEVAHTTIHHITVTVSINITSPSSQCRLRLSLALWTLRQLFAEQP